MTNKKNGQTEPENNELQSNDTALKDTSVKVKKKSETSSETLDEGKKAQGGVDSTSSKRTFDDQPVKSDEGNVLIDPVQFEEKQGKRGVKLGTLAIVISILFAGGAAFVFNQQNVQHQSQLAQLEAQINSMSNQIEQRLSSTEALAAAKADEAYNKADTAITQQHESIKSLQVALADVAGRRPNDWLLAESDYLVKLAGRKLFLEKDVVSATQLMESADQRISLLNDPSLMPLRKEMAKDITTLKSVPLIDKDGLVLRLISLQQQIDTLPLANAILPEVPIVESKKVSTDIYDWQDNLLTSLTDFSKQFITFRTREGNVIPLLAPKQHYYLKENVKGKIETAIRAVYNENQAIYQSSLKTADEWTMQFFKLDDPAVVQFNKSIQQLSGQNIEVKYPIKLVSQKALQDVINERLRRQVTSMTMEDKQ
ncbi:uroporphyrinogen-III C-methyltransferase [Vibrio sp. DW001]|uniref:uroporphyrinogen-III C-methyltransferase n=1 Tax=Vibrio sp. DW001 TaxID=2912315 RepID=UPI0023AE8302|nr:uroporphyrinogen-III C-methyltransferase [Vibrio sp. DW001]WED26619.1 uroporphyrinogen-III C-methyltransferase [Vibrio sp. DW001]